ncbi:MAG: FHA domain-containing protein [Comamonadaceae bacterium]|nr:FHA domain-containing protein [Comamonadaceae bacterium]RRD56098.1 FHA domain-containing protein [Comamonadaceae bacterium OH2545_COT-014]
MPKLIVSIDGVVIKEVQLTKDRSTLGRRPYNDVVIDNLAVSGEHAVIKIHDGQVTIEDQGSTNGTYVNGKSIKRQALTDGDTIEIGKYKIKYNAGRTDSMPLGAAANAPVPSVPMGLDAGASMPQGLGARGPRVRVLNGSAAGRELELTKVITTIGKPGVSVASITRKPHGFDLALVEGEHVPAVNGVTLDGGPITLKSHDCIELAGIRMEFIDS